MKIYGPYTRKDLRQHVIIVHSDGRKQTKSYPKYLLEQHIGRELLEHETVDHIDNDKTNNDITNLQILTRKANAEKSTVLRPRQVYKFACPVCGKQAEKFFNFVKSNWRKGKAGPYCSRQCAGKAHH